MMTLDITGQKFGFLTAKKIVGKIGPMIAWECECECGGTKIMRGPHLKYRAKPEIGMAHTLHCGCRSPDGHSKLPQYPVWVHNKHRMCREWAESFTAFNEQCYRYRYGRRFLRQPDKTLPLSPTNFLWTDEKSQNEIQKCIEVLVESGMSLKAATERAKRVSRQRRFQIIWQSQGLCTVCRKPREHYSAKCDACEIRQENIRTPYWLRKPKTPKPQRQNKDWRNCPWDTWLDGQVHVIQASDLPGLWLPHNARSYAMKRGLYVSVKIVGTTFVLQARKHKKR